MLLRVLLLGGPATAAAAGVPFSVQVALHPDRPVGSRYQRVALCGALALAATEVEGLRVGGLSGLAWREQHQRLYALSDRGRLFELRTRWRRGELVGAELVRAVRLRGPDGVPLVGADADAEGLARVSGGGRRRGQEELLISFEQRPRVWRFRADGRFVRDEPLPAPWGEVAAYRAPNQALEAVAWHPRWRLLFGSEQSLRAQPPGTLPLRSTRGAAWDFSANPTLGGSGLVDIAAQRDGTLLLLERAYEAASGRTVITLSRLAPDRARRGAQAPWVAERLVAFDSAEGWALDNFEGLAVLPGQRVLLVSDDNESATQRTLLLCLRLLPRR